MKYEANIELNEVIVRELNGEELAQEEIDREFFELQAQTEKANAEKKANALEKLKLLGLDENDLKAIGLTN